MKKFLFACCMTVALGVAYFGLSSHTAALKAGPFPQSTASDTLISVVGGTTNDTLTWASRSGASWKSSVVFQFDFTKVAGTAGGTVKIYGSANNGKTYGAALTTLNIGTGTSQTLQYAVTGNPYDHYLVAVIDTGSQTSAVVTSVFPQ